ncbi:hypothetical protein [Mycobacterium sp.]|uniref:hypothetical protein n=1 Tax=Mycobacterium sp. TaxID=1785 RepID=UPI003F9618A8
MNPKVTPDTLEATICRTGYTKSIRPPKEITEAEKKANAAAYSYTGQLSRAEYDHLVPLEVGGDPNDPRNLWVEPGDTTPVQLHATPFEVEISPGEAVVLRCQETAFD